MLKVTLKRSQGRRELSKNLLGHRSTALLLAPVNFIVLSSGRLRVQEPQLLTSKAEYWRSAASLCGAGRVAQPAGSLESTTIYPV